MIAQLAREGHFHVYMKGAPEMVARFCRSETGMDSSLARCKIILKAKHETVTSQAKGRRGKKAYKYKKLCNK